ILEAAGARNYSINAGGDVIVRGEPEPDRAWAVGIRHPRDPDRVAARLVLPAGPIRAAMATSGEYERGGHIVDPRTGRPPAAAWLSVTVSGPSLALADAYATTAFAMGDAGLAWLAARPGYEGYAIDRDLRPRWTAGFSGLLG
ncbi:MAG: FAD:protein FMN transferase, partial [Candidatus Limnocylindrales bacterium]